jgi:magnesium transporter
MLDLEKTLVYFITSLRANDLVLSKLKKGVVLPLYEEDEDLLEDAIIENKQAIEQSEIYRNILGSITDTYATIVSNNLNNVMKFLAGATIVLSIPTMIYSFLGMNVQLGEIGTYPYAALFVLIGSLIISIIIAIILKIKDML